MREVPLQQPVRPTAPHRTGDPGISSFSARAVLLEADARSLASEDLLARNALTREQVADPDGWIPLRRYAGFYRDAVAASGDPAAFWVGVGGRALVQAARVTGHAAAASSSVREALATWARLSALVVDSVRYHLESTPQADLLVARWPHGQASFFEDAHVSATVAFRRFVAYIAGPVRPTEAFLARPAPPSPEAIEEALGAAVQWNAEWPCLEFPPGTFDLPIHIGDPELHTLLVRSAERKLEMRRAERVSDRVRAAILEIGFERSARATAISSALDLAPRTLQRRLAEESVTLSEIRNAVFRDAAVGMLQAEGRPATEVAFRLGFASRSAFNRAVRRWTGQSPRELRAGAAGPGQR